MAVGVVADRGLTWLAGAADRPALCRQLWQDNPRRPGLLAAGWSFDVVIVGERLGVEAWDLLRRHRLPSGPIVVDHGASKVGFMVPTTGREVFVSVLGRLAPKGLEYQYLSSGAYFVVPGPEPHPDDPYQWLAPPAAGLEESRRPSAALAVMLGSAAWLLKRVDEWGASDGQALVAPKVGPELSAWVHGESQGSHAERVVLEGVPGRGE